MSLKAFHIVFVIASIAMSAFVGWWGILDYRSNGNLVNLTVGVVSIVSGCVLVWYSTWFIRKIRGMSRP